MTNSCGGCKREEIQVGRLVERQKCGDESPELTGTVLARGN